jgi:transposase
MMTGLFVGLDVGKEALDIAVRPSGEGWRESNDETGIAALMARLRPLGPALIVCEATGGFERAAIAALAAAGLPVVVANPRQVRDFARATGQLAKTDQLDAGILALFAERVRPMPRPLPDDAAQLLDAVLTRRRQLLERCSRRRRTAWALPPSRCTGGSRPTFVGSSGNWMT